MKWQLNSLVYTIFLHRLRMHGDVYYGSLVIFLWYKLFCQLPLSWKIDDEIQLKMQMQYSAAMLLSQNSNLRASKISWGCIPSDPPSLAMFACAHINIRHSCNLASFLGPTQLSVESGRGPGILSHASDVRIERMVERVYLCAWAHWTQDNQGTR